MREIKFRGKRVDTGEWVYGSLVQCDITGKRYILPMGSDANESDKVRHEGCLMLFTFEVIPETIGQYTGLKDKNCVEIYEGDIIKWFGYEVQLGRQIRPERIIYINDYIKDTYKILCITENTGQTVEVIGNIFEDGDLIANR